MPRKSSKKIDTKKNTMVCKGIDCRRKGEIQPEQNFYKCHVPGFDRYPLCKECIYNMIDNKDIESVYRILQMLDIPFRIDSWEAAESHSDGTMISAFKKYMVMAMAFKQLKDLRYKDSIFEKPKTEEQIEEENKIEEEEKARNTIVYSSKWFGNFTEEEIQYLDEYYNKLNVDENTKNMDYVDTAKKMALASLEMNKAFNELRETGNDKKYVVLRDTYDKLNRQFNNIKATEKANSDSLGCFGVVFDKVEKNQWIPKYEPEKKDVYDHLLEQFSNINKSI